MHVKWSKLYMFVHHSFQRSPFKKFIPKWAIAHVCLRWLMNAQSLVFRKHLPSRRISNISPKLCRICLFHEITKPFARFCIAIGSCVSWCY